MSMKKGPGASAGSVLVTDSVTFPALDSTVLPMEKDLSLEASPEELDKEEEEEEAEECSRALEDVMFASAGP